MRNLQDPELVSQLLRKAFRVIRRNYGCPGPDGVSIREIHEDLPAYVRRLSVELLNSEVKFAPGREVVIRTGSKTTCERRVHVYSIRERWLQCYLRLAIEPYLASSFADAVYSYRRGRTRYDGLRELTKANPAMVLLLDIRNFFGSVNRSRVQTIFRGEGIPESLALLACRALDHASGGLPRGNALAPLTANLYLKCIDSLFTSSYMRYSDDMLFGVKNRAEARAVERRVSGELARVDLALALEKTRLFVSPSASAIHGEYPWFQMN